jgi:hypothetical protein
MISVGMSDWFVSVGSRHREYGFSLRLISNYTQFAPEAMGEGGGPLGSATTRLALPRLLQVKI